MGLSRHGRSRATSPSCRASPPTPLVPGPCFRPYMMGRTPHPSSKTTASLTISTSSSPPTSLMGTSPWYALVLFWLYLPAFVILSVASWPYPIPPPWPSDGILYVGHMLGTFEMLSLIWSVALLLTSLLYLHLLINEPKCMLSGSPIIPCLTTPPPSPAALPMATNHLLSSTDSSPKVTADSSPLASNSPWDMPSPLPTHADLDRLPMTTSRALALPQVTTRNTRHHTSSSTAGDTTPTALRPSALSPQPSPTCSAPSREATPLPSSSGTLLTSSFPSHPRNPVSDHLPYDLPNDFFTDRNGIERTYHDLFPDVDSFF
jgi:hypothetical protein